PRHFRDFPFGAHANHEGNGLALADFIEHQRVSNEFSLPRAHQKSVGRLRKPQPAGLLQLPPLGVAEDLLLPLDADKLAQDGREGLRFSEVNMRGSGHTGSCECRWGSEPDKVVSTLHAVILPQKLKVMPIRKPSEELTKTRGKRSEEHTSELQSPDHLVCRLLLEKKKT